MNIRDFIIKHEGIRFSVYKDSLGIPTIGVGFNLTRRDASSIITNELKLDFNLILSGKLALTRDEVNYLLDKDIKECVIDLGHMFENFDTMPENAKLVLIDLRFNLGHKGLLGFPNTVADFKKGNYKSAANRLSKSTWAKQVKVRAVEDIALLNAI